MAKLKIDPEDEIQEGEVVESVWDFKKIVIGFLIISLLVIGFSYVFLPNRETSQPQALGVATSLSPTPALPKKEDVEKIIVNAREALADVTAENLTSSQAAVQKIISDLQGLQGKSGAKDLVCSIICKE